METIRIRTTGRAQVVDVTTEVREAIRRSGVREGTCVVFVPHTTAGVCVNEGYDPAVGRDLLATLDRLVPRQGDYRHAEGNADAHVKSALVGASAHLIVSGGEPAIGRWQAVFFCEFDGPRTREMWVKVAADPAAPPVSRQGAGG